VLDKAEYSALQSTLNSPIVSYRIVVTLCIYKWMECAIWLSVCLSVCRPSV